MGDLHGGGAFGAEGGAARAVTGHGRPGAVR